MKKLYSHLAALLALCALLASCAAPAAPEATAGPAAPSPEAAGTPAPPVGTDAPDIGAEREAVEAMLPILDSLVRSIGVGVWANSYAPRDEEFFWSVLYLVGENWGYTHPRVEQEGDTAIVPRQVMQEFAAAAFLDYDDLLPLPESYAHALQYDEGLDAYRLAPSDMGGAEVKLETIAAGAEGSLVVRMGLYSGPDDLMGMLDFTLVANPYADAVSEPVYAYTVCAVAQVPAS